MGLRGVGFEASLAEVRGLLEGGVVVRGREDRRCGIGDLGLFAELAVLGRLPTAGD